MEKKQYICEICKRQLATINGLSQHVSRMHKQLTNQEYYIRYGTLGKKSNHCSICGEFTRYTGMSIGYSDLCKNDACRIKKIQSTNLKRYGCKNVLQNQEIKTQIKKTCLEKYGVQNPQSLESVRIKKEATMKLKYGVKNPSQSEQIKARKRETVFSHYGVYHPNQSQVVREKTKKTCKERYGVENVFQCQKIKTKIKRHYSDTYGVYYPAQVPSILKKQLTNGKNALSVKQYVLNSGKPITYQSNPQLQFIRLCQELGYQVQNGPRLTYELDQKLHYYFTDFLIIYPTTQKRIVQIKGDNWYHKENIRSGQFRAKCESAIQYSRLHKYLDFIVIMC